MRKAFGLLVLMLVVFALASVPSLAQPAPAPASSCGCVAAPSAGLPVSSYPGVPVSSYPGVPASLDLMPYLQAEVNEVAMLTAQSNSLRQQGDTLNADLIASYIPDHRMQVARLQYFLGGTPQVMSLQPNEAPFLGSAADIISHDRDAHAAVANQYRTLLQQTVYNHDLHQLALLGLNGASRHFDSLTVAQATVAPTSISETEGLMAALSLEKESVADLQTQAEQLQAMGDFRDANVLLSQVPAHQQQIASLSSDISQSGGNPIFAVPPLVPPLSSPGSILIAERVSDTQLARTYALPIALLPASDPLHLAAVSGQQIAMSDLALTGTTGPIV